MATCSDKKAAWQSRVIVIDPDASEETSLKLTALGVLEDVLYSCEGPITYAPLNPRGYRIPEVMRGTQKATGREAPETRPFVYIEVTGGAGSVLTLWGRLSRATAGGFPPWDYELDGSTSRIGPLGPYNCGPSTRFTVFGETMPTVELVIEDGPNELPADAETPPPFGTVES